MPKMTNSQIYEQNIKIIQELFKQRNEIIGIDLGTHTTGFYSKKSGGLAIQPYTKNLGRIARISAIKEILRAVMKEHGFDQYNCIAFIEDYAYALRQSTISQMAELGGIVKTTLFESKIPYYMVASATLKKMLLGPKEGTQKGSKKARTMVEILDRYNIKFTDDNIADAYTLYRFGLALRSYINKPDIKKKWEQELFKNFITKRGNDVNS